MEAIWKFHWDCGRMGNISSVFIATKEDIQKAIGKTVYLGEVLGKHSDVYGELEKEHITFVTDDKEFVKLFIKYDLSNGYNPLNYINDTENAIEDPLYIDVSDIYKKDMKGEDCNICGLGTYTEMTIQDDWQGVLHCDSCMIKIERYIDGIKG